MPPKYDVSIIRCQTYDPGQVRQALEALLAPLGGLDWVRPGMRIALKANLVAARKPEAGATTHPVLLLQLAQMLQARGAQVVVGDSPGGLFTAVALRHVYDVCGLRQLSQAGVTLNEDISELPVAAPTAKMAKNFVCTGWLRQVDAIINVCKLKSHGMMGMSAAAKNMFGAIPGTKKPEYHFRFPNMEEFADMIVDLDEYFAPVLHIVDAVVGMEGNGPTQGTPKPMGALLAGSDPHRVDLVCARMLGFRPQEIPTLTAAQRRGLIPDSVEELHIFGDVNEFLVDDFEKIDTRNDLTFKSAAGGGLAGRLFGAVAKTVLASRPQLHAQQCVGCGECGRICPAGAITMQDKLPQIDRSRCIRCFCCQEFCPKGAMRVHRTWLARLLSRG